MPYCWTHNNNMKLYNYTENQVYLGWAAQSPQFETTANGVWNFAHVAYLFWEAMCNDCTVIEALNSVADDVYGVQFSQSWLSYKLLVYGNMNLELPEE